MIYFDRIEVVNILSSSSGKYLQSIVTLINCYMHTNMLCTLLFGLIMKIKLTAFKFSCWHVHKNVLISFTMHVSSAIGPHVTTRELLNGFS
jgi:hypothetical protein